ncbi:dynein heavy chain 5, axonemal-like [Centruroides sculpturatus]|uniref:dynein heavy chain 5, axonemal-like n=1 Tax=Centruroides sculpturatus TaxID=218467 RepID=UPI000C6DD062|nr:dynein heavy chain 5, axonemal-like [Centruroides sculpturatus]
MASISSVLESLAAVYRPSSERCAWQPASAFLVKYTNSLIRSCRKFLVRNGIPNVLNQREEEWIEKIDSCLTLAREYRRYFREMKKSRGVFRDVSETLVFANLDDFCLLLEKIRNIPDPLRRYPGPFDREKRELREAAGGLKNGVRRSEYVSYDTFDPDDANFDADCANLLAAAEALKKPKARSRTVPFLTEAGDEPGRILRFYDRELDRVCRLFVEYRRKPPTLRGFSRIAERIAWTKRLSERIEEPFRRLPDFDDVLQGRQGKAVLEKYKCLAGQLERHAALLHRTWFERFCRMEDFLKEPVLVQDPPGTAEVSVYNGRLWIFLAECVQISRMKLEIPEAGRILMSKEEELKRCRYVIQRALEEYAEIKRSVPEKLRPLTEPHLKRMESLWLWGIRTQSWGSLALESYARSCTTNVGQLRLLLSRINSLLYDRIESMLGTLSDIQVLKFPTHRSLCTKELISVAEVSCRNSSESIQRLNVSIEDSVMELIDVCLEDLVSQIHNDRPTFPQMSSESAPFVRMPFPADDDFLQKTEREADLLLDSFALRTKETVRGLLHRALEFLRTMLTSHHSTGEKESSFLCLETTVVDGETGFKLHPSLTLLQGAIDRIIFCLLEAAKGVSEWKRKPRVWLAEDKDYDQVSLFDDRSQLVARSRAPYASSLFEYVVGDGEMTESRTALSTSVLLLKEETDKQLARFSLFRDLLYVSDKRSETKTFLASRPSLHDFRDKMMYYKDLEEKILLLPDAVEVKCLNLVTEQAKKRLAEEAKRRYVEYGTICKDEYNARAKSIVRTVRDLIGRMSRSVHDTDDAEEVLEALARARDLRIDIELDIGPIEECYGLMNQFGMVVKRDEIERVDVLRYWWTNLNDCVTRTENGLETLQSQFALRVEESLTQFLLDCDDFCLEYLEIDNGSSSRCSNIFAEPNHPICDKQLDVLHF